MIKIIENCTDQFVADEIEKIFFDKFTYWWYDPSTIGNSIDYDRKKFHDTYQLIHPIIDNGRHDSAYTSLILSLTDKILEDQLINVLTYRRIKVNQLLKSSENRLHPPHIDDSAENMISIVYYINDSDGPTYFFDKNLEIIDSVEPKKNRCVLFPSNLLHASSSPLTSDRRLVVNIVASTSGAVRL
jgi:hypothetical protein